MSLEIKTAGEFVSPNCYDISLCYADIMGRVVSPFRFYNTLRDLISAGF